MTGRKRLPDRRPCETIDVLHAGERYHANIGYYPDGRPGEIFIRGAKVGSDSDAICDDAAVLVSRLLQRGDRLPAIALSLGRHGYAGHPTGLIGAVVDRLARLVI